MAPFYASSCRHELSYTIFYLGYHTCEQRKDKSQARQKIDCEDVQESQAGQKRDCEDIKTVLNFLRDRSPSTRDSSLRNNETRVIADQFVNADNARDVGTAIIESLVGQSVTEYSLKRKQQIESMGGNTSIKVDGETLHTISKMYNSS